MTDSLRGDITLYGFFIDCKGTHYIGVLLFYIKLCLCVGSFWPLQDVCAHCCFGQTRRHFFCYDFCLVISSPESSESVQRYGDDSVNVLKVSAFGNPFTEHYPEILSKRNVSFVFQLVRDVVVCASFFEVQEGSGKGIRLPDLVLQLLLYKGVESVRHWVHFPVFIQGKRQIDAAGDANVFFLQHQWSGTNYASPGEQKVPEAFVEC